MPHLCLFGGTEGRLDTHSSAYFTVFGSAELYRQPAARMLAEERREGQARRPRPQHFFFTLFGGTELHWPPLAEEYVALRDSLQSGTLSLADWDRLIGDWTSDTALRLNSLTLFGSFEPDSVPPEAAELDALSLQRHLGHIPDTAVDVLILAIGSKGVQRLAAVRSAMGQTLSLANR